MLNESICCNATKSHEVGQNSRAIFSRRHQCNAITWNLSITQSFEMASLAGRAAVITQAELDAIRALVSVGEASSIHNHVHERLRAPIPE